MSGDFLMGMAVGMGVMMGLNLIANLILFKLMEDRILKEMPR
jgi:hypothetical protein